MDKNPDFDELYDVSDDDGEVHRAQLVIQAAKERKLAQIRAQIAKYDARDSRNQQIGEVWSNVRDSHRRLIPLLEENFEGPVPG